MFTYESVSVSEALEALNVRYASEYKSSDDFQYDNYVPYQIVIDNDESFRLAK